MLARFLLTRSIPDISGLLIGYDCSPVSIWILLTQCARCSWKNCLSLWENRRRCTILNLARRKKPKMFLCAWHTLIHPWHDIRLEFAFKVNKQFLKKIYVVLLLFFVCVTNLSLYWKKVVVGVGCLYAVTYHFIWECNEPMQ